MDEKSIDRIIVACSKTININEVLSVAGTKPEGSHEEFCLQMAERIARRYLAQDLEFQAADRAINWLFAYCYAMEESSGEMPTVARELYEAFDSGEFYHGNDRDKDPEKEFTLPLIRQIVET
jgi:hypothetical protein